LGLRPKPPQTACKSRSVFEKPRQKGLDHEIKTADLLAQTLGRQTGRSYRSLNYAISGAVLDAPGIPPGNDDSLYNGYS
jgi:hypothetical protein